jgi:hypothetical protein
MYPQPSASATRPAYLDNLFRDAPAPHTPSLHSSTSSISCSSTASSYDLRSAFLNARPLTPAQETMDDHFSLRSKKSFINPRRFRFGRIFSTRRTEITEDVTEPVLPPTNPSALAQSSCASPRRPSLPLLQTSFPPPRGASTYAKKPLPAVPQTRAQELTCRRCYYSNARNCHGWVMGGTSGAACETCLVCVHFKDLLCTPNP